MKSFFFLKPAGSQDVAFEALDRPLSIRFGIDMEDFSAQFIDQRTLIDSVDQLQVKRKMLSVV
ncbi:MAG TPA: hypothetical protein VL026_13625 [Rhizomicrobium sp.]|nr:hypothetical protein [Rhizomicrobium sp.]